MSSGAEDLIRMRESAAAAATTIERHDYAIHNGEDDRRSGPCLAGADPGDGEADERSGANPPGVARHGAVPPPDVPVPTGPAPSACALGNADWNTIVPGRPHHIVENLWN